MPGGVTLSRDPASAAFVADVPGRLHFDPVAVGVLADDGADIVRIWMAAACESPYGIGRPEQHRREQAELPSRHQATDERVRATAGLRSNINAKAGRRQALSPEKRDRTHSGLKRENPALLRISSQGTPEQAENRLRRAYFGATSSNGTFIARNPVEVAHESVRQRAGSFPWSVSRSSASPVPSREPAPTISASSVRTLASTRSASRSAPCSPSEGAPDPPA